MGIIGCEVEYNYKQKEKKKEVEINEDENSLKKLYNEYKSKYPAIISETDFINQYKSKHFFKKRKPEKKSENIKTTKNINIKIPGKMGLNKKIFNLKKNKEQKLNQDEINEINNDDLIIITPRNNIIMDSYNNEITDEYTIKNETVVYNLENSKDNLKYSTNLEEIKEELKNEENEKNYRYIKNKKANNNEENLLKNKLINSKSFISKKKLNIKKLNLNYAFQNVKVKKDEHQINNYEKDITHKSRSNNNKNNKYLKKKIFNNNNKNENNNIINNRSYNNNNLNVDTFQHSNRRNQQSSTLENQNLQLRNILLQQLPLIQKEEILPKIERKTYQEDLILLKDKNYNKNKLFSEPKKNKLKEKYFNQLNDKQNNYLFFENNNNNCINDNSEIIKKLNNIYQFLSKENNNFINNNEKILYRKNKSPKNIYTNSTNPILRKKTDFHTKNKSYNNKNTKYNFSMNNNDNNSFFSLFNNSTNLSINFINKVNKSARSCQKIISFLDKQNINFENNNNFNNFIGFNNNIGNPYIYYNNFNKGNIDKTKINKTSNKYKNKNNKMISNSKSCNNMLINKGKNSNSYKNNNNINYTKKALTQQIKVYIPKNNEKSLINKDIINNTVGNKYIFTYEKIDNFDTEKILYDGIIYKVIDNIEINNIDNNSKYKLIDRYFQITKNCFKYYNDIDEAINEKDKPLVQFDIRYIRKLDIFDNNFLEKYKIHGTKKVNIVFCIYINQNNDFFVFAHDNINIGNNIINILLFLKSYYENK